MAPSTKRPAPVLNELEMEAIRSLVELRFLRKRQGFLESLSFSCLPFPWGAQRPRTISNSVGGELTNAEDTETTAKVSEEPPPRKIVRKFKFKMVERLPHSEIVARAVKSEPVLKSPPLQPEGIASPTSPLLNGTISLSSHGEPSDSNNSQRISPPDHSKIQFKLVLKSEGKEEDKRFLHTFDSSQQTMLSHSRDSHSLSRRDFLPDLNIPIEESPDNNFGDFDNQLLKIDKFVAAAHARKHRAEYLRYKRSHSGNVHSK